MVEKETKSRCSVFVGVHMPPTMLDKLRAIAVAEDRTVSAVIRQMVNSALAKRDGKKG